MAEELPPIMLDNKKPRPVFKPKYVQENEDLTPRKKFWDRLDYELEGKSNKGRLKFFAHFLITGFLLIILGDGFFHLTFTATGVFMIIIGIIFLILAFAVPIIMFIDHHDNN